MPTTKKLLTIAATAEALSLSKTTIRDLIRRGIFKPNRVTRRPLIPVTQVEEFARS